MAFYTLLTRFPFTNRPFYTKNPQNFPPPAEVSYKNPPPLKISELFKGGILIRGGFLSGIPLMEKAAAEFPDAKFCVMEDIGQFSWTKRIFVVEPSILI